MFKNGDAYGLEHTRNSEAFGDNCVHGRSNYISPLQRSTVEITFMSSPSSSPKYSRPRLRRFHLVAQRMCPHGHLQHFMGSLARFAGT